MKLIMTLFFFLLLFCVQPVSAETVSADNIPAAEIMRLGEQMYRRGILPSGKPMEAFIRGDVEVDSSVFSCASCHLYSGLGSFEGGVITPPTTGTKLYKPYRRSPTLGDIADRSGRSIYSKTLLERPPYTRKTLAHALLIGSDPVNQSFNDVMPRYVLNDSDVAILIRYLELLSSEPSPGTTATSFAFATIITDDISADERAALMAPLQSFVDGMNQQAAMYKDFVRFGYTPTADMKFAFHQGTLSVWNLKGDPATWPAQLAAYYAQEPVFAVLGGMSHQPWLPIHQFCEEQRLPCLFPVTELPAISENSWYTYYFNKGRYQEGEATARYLNRDEGISATTRVVQIIQDSHAGKALADGFSTAWAQSGRSPVTNITVTARQLRTPGVLAKIILQSKPSVLLLWSNEIKGTELAALATGSTAPERIFISSGYLGSLGGVVPETARKNVFISYPYRLTPFVGTKQGFDAKVPILATIDRVATNRISSQTETALKQSTLQGMRLLEDNLFRDYLLDAMSMLMDQTVLDFERLSFGPGQRYVSKGCYIIQLGPGDVPALLPRSGWVIQ